MHDTMTPPEGAVISDLDIFTHDNIRNPLGWHASLCEAAPLVWLSKYQVWATGRHAEVHSILKDWKSYCSSAGVGLANFHHEKPWRPPSLLLEADPPDHTRRRTVAGRVMSNANLGNYLVDVPCPAPLYQKPLRTSRFPRKSRLRLA